MSPFLTTIVSSSRAFDSIASPAAILDPEGRIASVNEAWRTFADLNGPVDRQLRVGAEYTELWVGRDPAGEELAAAVGDLISGRSTYVEAERWWPTPVEDRWVLVRVAHLIGDGRRGAVVVHDDITARKLLEQRLAEDAHTDSATGLRTGYRPAAGSRVRDLTVVAIDVGGLAAVERSHGPSAAEGVLVHVVARIRRLVREGDLLWRVSRWELAVAGEGVGDGAALVRRLRRALAGRYQVAARPVDLTFSVQARPAAGDVNLLDAVRAASHVTADQRSPPPIRSSAPAHRHGIRHRTPGRIHRPPSSDAGRTELEALTRSCVQAGQVPLVFQPITRFADGAVVGAEALLRVVDGRGAPVAPLDVIATADQLGLAPALGGLVVDAACAEAVRWQRAHPERQLSVAVNLAAAQFRDRGVAEHVAGSLAAAGLEPARLHLEVAERDLVDDPAWSARQLALLKMLGVGLTVDDYGTGHASLVHLRRFPVDALKVDLSLVAGLPDNPDDLAIVAATMGVAGAFGLRVVAKGVEQGRQLAELDRLGCRYGQGFLWSGAVSGEAFLHQVETAVAIDTVADGSGPSAGRANEVDQLDTVLRSLVHEIRTPLTVAMGYSSLLEQSVAPDQVAAAANIRRATERINHLLGNLEDVRLIDQGALVLEARRLDLRTLVEDVITDLRSVLHVPLAVEHRSDLPVLVDGDEVRLGQVVANLVTNAARFTPRTGRVVVRVHARDAWAEVAVEDDGPGVDQQDLALIFRKYGRADRAHRGTGLGLYLARGTARAHGGDVRYRRRRGGRGSTFTLQLPRPGSGPA